MTVLPMNTEIKCKEGNYQRCRQRSYPEEVCRPWSRAQKHSKYNKKLSEGFIHSLNDQKDHFAGGGRMD